MVKKNLFVVVVAIMLLSVFYAKGQDIRFRRITINEGLSLSSVYCVFQDSKGFMWFGTEDGLNRYDGKNFTIFRPNPKNPNTLSHKWIELIYEDHQGVLWFGSRGGLTRFNPRTESFVQYTQYSEDSIRLSNDTITAIAQSEFIWVGTLKGLNRINPQTLQLERIAPQGEGLQGLSSRINALLPDNKGNLWIGTQYGLYCYKSEDHQFSKIKFPANQNSDIPVYSLSLGFDELWIGSRNGVMSILFTEDELKEHGLPHFRGNGECSVERVFVDHRGGIWVTTSYGLFFYDEDKGSYLPMVRSVDSSNSLATNTSKPLFEDSQGYIWYGTFGDGLYRISSENHRVINFRNNPADAHSLSQNSINTVYEDRSGVLWVGTFGAGISIYNPQSHKFDLYRNNPLNRNSLSSNFVWTVFEASNGAIWIGTNDKGLNYYDPAKGAFTFYDHKPGDPSSLSSSSVRCVYEDSKGNVWVGTNGEGLNLFNPSRGTFTHYKNKVGDTTSLSNNSVRAIMEDSKGRLWIGTRDGLNRFYKSTGLFKRFMSRRDDPQSISHNFVYSEIYEDHKGYLWIGTYGGGLNRMDPDKEIFTHYGYDEANEHSLSDNVVFSVYEQDDGILWIGTNRGLNRMDTPNETFRCFGPEQGLPNEVVYGVLPDKKNNLWLSTNNGISRFNMKDYSIKNFDVNDGLQSNEFNGGAFHGGRSGRLYFGGVYGLNIIEPENIVVERQDLPVVFTKFEILGKEVSVGIPPSYDREDFKGEALVKEGDEFFMKENVAYSKGVVLDWRHRFFSLEFTVLNNLLPQKVSYAYRMEDLDKDWTLSGTRNYVSYANLIPGEHLFQVKAQDKDGNWSDKMAQIYITVIPPFWKTWWFLILEGFLVSVVAIFVYRYLLKARTNKLLKRQNQRIREANQKLVVSERNLKELNATKDKFFSIISHDLKNPFTSLLSISEMLHDNYDDIDDQEKCHGMRRMHNSVKQIYQLLENLLTWSRAQTGRIKFDPRVFDMLEVIEENMELYYMACEKKNIKLRNRVAEPLWVYGDSAMINTVLRNLLNNAVKFTPEGGAIEVFGIYKEDFCEVMVKDQGVGMSAEDLQKLFRIDLKYKREGTQGEKGTGLGLILCKEFVEQNGGQIRVNSVLGEGSEFIITVPKSEDNPKNI